MVGIFAGVIFKQISLSENILISLNISLKSVSRVPINNIPAFVQIMAWRRPGDKLLSEPMMVSLLTYICVTRTHWVNKSIKTRLACKTSIKCQHLQPAAKFLQLAITKTADVYLQNMPSTCILYANIKIMFLSSLKQTNFPAKKI